MKRTNFTKKQLKELRTNLILYETYRRSGELEKETRYNSYFHPLIEVTKRSPIETAYGELCYLIALDSNDRAYISYDDEKGDECFKWLLLEELNEWIEWQPLEEIEDDIAPERIYEHISNYQLELCIERDLEEFESRFDLSAEAKTTQG